MVGVNAAHGLCRVWKAAFYFFKSSARVASGLLDFVLVARPFVFAADEEDFRHSLAVHLTPPQKRQRLLAKWWACSADMSLSSFLSLSLKSGVFLSEFWVDDLELSGVDIFLCCLFWLFWFEELAWFCSFSVHFSEDCCYIPEIWTEIILYFGGPNQSCESFS